MKALILLIVLLAFLSVFVPQEYKNVFYNLSKKQFENVKIYMQTNIQLEKEVWKRELIELQFNQKKNATFVGNTSSWVEIPEVKNLFSQFRKCIPQGNIKDFSWKIVQHRILLGAKKKISVVMESHEDTNIFIYKLSAWSKQRLPQVFQVHDCSYNNESTVQKNIELRWNSITSDMYIAVSSKNDHEYSLNINELPQ